MTRSDFFKTLLGIGVVSAMPNKIEKRLRPSRIEGDYTHYTINICKHKPVKVNNSTFAKEPYALMSVKDENRIFQFEIRLCEICGLVYWEEIKQIT